MSHIKITETLPIFNFDSNHQRLYFLSHWFIDDKFRILQEINKTQSRSLQRDNKVTDLEKNWKLYS